MSLRFDIFGILGTTTGKKLVAALYLPSGLTSAAGATIIGGTVTGAHTITTASSVIYLGLSEDGTLATYGGESVISALPDTTDRPYTVEVREVADATTMTGYSAIATAFAAATEVVAPRQLPDTGGWIVGGLWTVDPKLDTPVSESGDTAPLAVIALPATSRMPRGTDTRNRPRLQVSQFGRASLPLTVFDAFEVALTDLADRTLRFVVHDDNGTSIFTVEDDAITRNAGSEEIDPFILLDVNPGSTAPGQYQWQLWDITASEETPIDLGSGLFVVRRTSLGT